MNANEALELSKQNWAENEQKYLSHVIGFQTKVETAAKAGRTGCPIGVVPTECVDFISYYFEGMGYYTILQPASPTDTLIWLTWKNIPDISRAYLETKEMDKFLSSITSE